MMSWISFQRGQSESGPKSLWRGLGFPGDLFEEEKVDDINERRSKITKGDNRTGPMNQARRPRTSEKMHETVRPRGLGKFQRKSCQDETEEGNHHREMKDDVKGSESPVDMAGLFRLHVLGEKDSLCPQFSLFPEFLTEPQDGMKPEDTEDPHQKGRHEDESPVKNRVPLRIVMSGMGNPLGEVGVGPGMAFSAGLDQPLFRDEGLRIVRRQDIVKTVAVGTARHETGIPQFLDLSVVALIIGLGRDQKDVVSFHHLPVGMALLTDLRMKLLPERDHFRIVPF